MEPRQAVCLVRHLLTTRVVTIHPVNDVWVRLECDESVTRELSDYFTFDVPGAHFMPAARKGWDRKIRLFKMRTRTLYRGLVPRIIEFAAARGYEVINKVIAPAALFEGDALNEWIAAARIPMALRDYQIAAMRFMLDRHRGIIISPTGSGKSLIIYLMSMMCVGNGNTPGKVLIVVPTLGLVTQMASDFLSYGCEPQWIQTIQGGKTKDIVGPLVVSTWQSIYEQPKAWFDQFEGVIVDEVHLAKSKSLAHLMEQCEQVHWRFGFTGTLDQTQCHRLILEGLFGTVMKVATTNQLVKAKHLTPPRVIVMVLEYPDAVKKQLRRCEYTEEIDFLVSSGPRNKFLALLCREQKHNTLLLFQLVVKMGASLYARVRHGMESPEDRLRGVHYIDGSISAENRESIRKQITTAQNDVLIASYGTTQLGVNIPSLRTLILAHPSKSIIRVLQSIGRILRLDEGKNQATIIDVVDDLRIGKWQNHTWRHAEARMAYYAAEKFPVVLRRVPLALFAAAPASPETTNDTQGDQ